MSFMLVKNPGMEYAKEIVAYREEMLAAESSMDGCGSLRRHGNPQDWIAYNALLSNPATVPDGRVVSSQFILTDETGRIYAMLQVRHVLNAYLRNFAGHIGYSVRPSERRKGYAKKMLSMALEVCKTELQLPAVMVSCLVENEASRRTILSCGGIFEEKVFEHIEGKWLEKYWISLG
ncbi:MAG: GNAT family N-acetyltransferase [Lachnospiraceae bacterium]|nr:GNAT family N-acetyltransferase [Lachnospiraceae bacterium]